MKEEKKDEHRVVLSCELLANFQIFICPLLTYEDKWGRVWRDLVRLGDEI